ncbi:CRP-like cAMP-binding protein [Balneicella halophila]|uniref:CRP-like cAMP-binding protein n=1 Tax=Balneicella halophila TaxID=1537566 RepID=A0A7L4UP05_BALHA|nr:Crp/Fnr family transcriptional regulator [Balneicella halophila]PVX50017.1 CRP-like cAMP-binding protein [Balneicella halophila]
MIKILSQIPLFKGISIANLSHAFEKIHYQVRDYQAENIIAYSGDTCDSLHVLLEGRVRGEVANFNGKNVVVDDIFAPSTFAEAFLFATQDKLLVNIVATTQAKVLRIPKEEFLRLLQMEDAILRNYLNATANRFVTVSQKLRFLSLKNVKQKLAHYLLGIKQQHPDKDFFPLGKTHEALAALFGITRPALTKNLLALQEENIIVVKNKRVKILDERLLMSYLGK